MNDLVETNGKMEGWKINALAIGAIGGALVGLGGAYLMIRKADQSGDKITIEGGDAVRLGLLIFGLLRSLSELGVKG